MALPATTGIREADQKQLEQFIGPIVNAWLASQYEQVQHVFEEHISKDIIVTAKNALSVADEQITGIAKDLKSIREEIGT